MAYPDKTPAHIRLDERNHLVKPLLGQGCRAEREAVPPPTQWRIALRASALPYEDELAEFKGATGD